jgi:uncharacterized protein (DUF2236 family)
MTRAILPADDELASLVPTPESIVWRRAGDARTFTAAGYALLMQVAHPTVAAGVREHSSYASDPWGRLLRTLDYVNVLVYGGADAAGTAGRRLREMHRHIRGVDPRGRRYHALEPQAYAWVHATLADAIIVSHARFGRPMDAEQVRRFHREFRALGRVHGVRERDLPADWDEFREYFDEMVETRLEDNDVVQGVLETLVSPKPPPIPGLGPSGWRVARLPLVRALKLATVGLLPPVLRRRFGLRWTAAQELELRALGAASRSATPVMPRSLRTVGPAYLRWRQDAIARGDFARRSAPDRAAA